MLKSKKKIVIFPQQRFKLHPEKCHNSMNWRVKVWSQKIKVLKMTQFPVNSNIATTGHILEGQTKTFDCNFMESQS